VSGGLFGEQNVRIPYAFQGYVPCAAGGAGEVIEVSGTLHVREHTTYDSNGGVHTMALAHPQGVSGVGLTTGDKYHATGMTMERYNASLAREGSQYTLLNNFRLIGQGKGNNYLVHQNIHVTVNANGEVTADVDNVTFDCR
jgi:hypothetical protein